MPRHLNVGCGPDIRPKEEGWTNMDIVPLPGVDVVHDITEFPWPFEDGSFDHIFLSHVMEHVPHYWGTNKKDGFLLIMEEFHRILAPSGTVEIISPHHESVDRWADPTHTRVVHPRNFQYFDPDAHYGYYSDARFRVRTTETTKRSAIFREFLPLGRSRLGLFEHVGMRIPGMRPLIYRRPWELRVVLEKA